MTEDCKHSREYDENGTIICGGCVPMSVYWKVLRERCDFEMELVKLQHPELADLIDKVLEKLSITDLVNDHSDWYVQSHEGDKYK